MDLDFSPKIFEMIVAILKEWIELQVIEWDEVEERLKALNLDLDTIDWLMESVNAIYVTDVEKQLIESIEEYNQHQLNY
jgi:hypothetical protein